MPILDLALWAAVVFISFVFACLLGAFIREGMGGAKEDDGEY
jgi:hypothetical protein